MDVHSTSFERYRRQMDIKTKLLFLLPLLSLLTQAVIWTTIQDFFERYGRQMDVKTML